MNRDLAALARALEDGEAVVAGVLSGTSADGIDVVLARPEPAGGLASLAFRTLPFPPELADRVRALLDAEAPARTPAAFAFLARDLGAASGDAVVAVARAAGEEVALVGSHGQTLFHHDGTHAAGRATLQLGCGATIAARTGATVACDFRALDVALGGEGAPLSALADPVLFARAPRPAAVLNLGGLANLTELLPGATGLAFDTGPAGALLDGLARALLDRPFDADGEVAARGRVDAQLLDELLAHPYYERRPPKSTGRDTFGPGYVPGVLARGEALGLPAEDLLRTAVELVARTVATAAERFLARPLGPLIVCGGGVHHAPLQQALEEHWPSEVLPATAVGVDPDAREALVFAELARRTVLGRASTAPAVTGARAGGVLGALHQAPRPGSEG